MRIRLRRPLLGLVATLPAQALAVWVGFGHALDAEVSWSPLALLLAVHAGLLLLAFALAENLPRVRPAPLTLLLVYLALLAAVPLPCIIVGSPFVPRQEGHFRALASYVGLAAPALLLVHWPAIRREALDVQAAVRGLLRSAFFWASAVVVMVSSVGLYNLEKTRHRAQDVWRKAVSSDVSEYPYVLRKVVRKLKLPEPTQVAADPRLPDRFYVTTRGGTVFLVRPAGTPQVQTAVVVPDIEDASTGELGLVGIALHPSLATDASRPWVFLMLAAKFDGTLRNRLIRFDVDPVTGLFDADSQRVLIDQEDEHPMHNGGGMVFGKDGFLYIGVGDGGGKPGRRNAQHIDTDLFSGVLRIDVDCRGDDVSRPVVRQPAHGRTEGYCIPNDNPFIGHPGALEEFWSIGLRNPFRLSLEPTTGEIWVADVGGKRFEEINIARKGSNHMWPRREGPIPIGKRDRRRKPFLGDRTEPLYAYPHLNLRTCVIGGTHYRGSKHPELDGGYVFTDCTSGEVFVLRRGADGAASIEPIARLRNVTRRGIVSVDQVGEDIMLTMLGSPAKPNGRILQLAKRAPGQRREPAAPLTADATYAGLCARCHGDEGKPSPDIQPPPADFTSPQWQERTSDARMLSVIRDGGAAAGLDASMPPWKGVLTDAQIRDLVPYLRSLGSAP